MPQQKWLVSEPKTIEVDGIRRMKVGLVGGHVDVLAHDEPVVRIEVHGVRGKDLRITADGETLEIDHAQLSWENWLDVFRYFRPGASQADVSLLVPRDVALTLGVVSATALVSGLTADTTLSTVSGDVTTDDLRGELRFNAVSGELVARNHGGRLSAHTVSGDITASGPLVSYASDSVSGAVFLDLRESPDAVKVNTVSGAVTVRLDADAAAAYSVNTVGGKLQIGDGMTVRGAGNRYTGRFGKLEGRWTDLRVNTVGGDVSVLRTDRAAASAS